RVFGLARPHGGLVDLRKRGQVHTRRTLGKRRGSGRLDAPAIFTLLIGADLATYIITEELDQEGEQTIGLRIPGIATTQQKASPGQRHVKIGIRSSSRINCLFAAVPFAEEK